MVVCGSGTPGSKPSKVQKRGAKPDTYLGIRVDTSIPVYSGLCLGLTTPEAQSLTATLVAQHGEGPENQWIGEIQLLPVPLASKNTAP